MENSRLQTLPAELRNAIYELVLISDTEILINIEYRHSKQAKVQDPSPGLLQPVAMSKTKPAPSTSPATSSSSTQA